MASDSRQPLLEGPERPLLLEGPPAPADTRSIEDRLREEEEAKYARGASRVVTYTIWFLLAAIMIGTIVGIIFVTIPMQQGSTPGPRKSAALLVVSQEKQEPSLRLKSGSIQDNKLTEAVVWSGKGRHSPVPLEGMYSFSAFTSIWNDISNQVTADDESGDVPIPRWKAMTFHEPSKPSLIVQGGDPLAADGAADHYLDDLWRLSLPDDRHPEWTKFNTTDENGTDVCPSARRAHAGVVVNVDGESTLIIHGGRTKSGELLSDVWAASLDDPSHVQWWLKRDLPNELDDASEDIDTGSAYESDENSGIEERESLADLSKKHHKKARKNYPASRKGHLAVALPESPHDPLMVIMGGRNDTNYYSDIWQYDYKANSWRSLPQKGHIKPTPRDHFGGFYHNGLIYIFGGRGSTESEYISAKALDDLWTYDLSTGHWTEIEIKGDRPLERFLYSYDTFIPDSSSPDDLRFVVMGGESSKHCYLNDLWEYSVQQNKWKQWGALKVDPAQKKCEDL